jgi:hypothetical protein
VAAHRPVRHGGDRRATGTTCGHDRQASAAASGGDHLMFHASADQVGDLPTWDW